MSSIFVGDPPDRAFERLYERYVREVYRYVLAMVRNPAEAEDVTQTTFLNAYRALQAGAKPHAPHNWLIAIAHNTCRSSVRRSMRRPHEVPLGEAEIAAAEPDRSNVDDVLRAVGRLPFNQRSALAMRELEGRTYPEIAETLGVTVPAVEALIARARRTLRTQVGTLRGLTAMLLPRSLRKLWENGEPVVGGALGVGVTAKAAALVLVGVAGFATVEAGPLHEARTPQSPTLTQRVAPAAAAPASPVRTVHARALPVRPRAAVTTRGQRPQQHLARPVTVGSGSASSPAGVAVPEQASRPVSTAVSSPAPAQDQTAEAVQQTASAVTATVAASVPQAPPLPVATPELPPAPAPTVSVSTPELPVTPPPLP